MANETIKALQSRREKIDNAVEGAQKGKKKKAPAPKNPYPAGSARAKYWARRQADKKKKPNG